MDFRKLIFIMTLMISIFLCIIGSAFLVYSGSSSSSNNPDSKSSRMDEILEPLKPIAKSVNILILGGDQVGGNTDTIMLANYNPSTANMSLLSIPRDTKVNVTGSSVPKINAAYPIGGEKLAVDTVKSFMGVDINYYIFIDTSAFKKIVDLLDGVDVFVPVDMDYDDPYQNLAIHFKKGQQHMNGTQAEEFVRFRKPNNYNNEVMQYYDGSDLKRIDAQQSFLKELIQQKVNIKYLTKLNSLINIVFKNIKTNLTLDEMLKLPSNVYRLDYSAVKMLKVPGRDSDEASGWYYLADKAETEKLTKQYFSSGAGQLNNSKNKAKTNENNRTSNEEKSKSSAKNTQISESSSPAATKNSDDQITSFTQDNPSNNETSMGDPAETMP